MSGDIYKERGRPSKIYEEATGEDKIAKMMPFCFACCCQGLGQASLLQNLSIE
jgi:hypothetical protein